MLNKVGSQLDDSVRIIDLLEYSDDPTREIPSVFFEAKSPEVSQWYSLIRELTAKQRRVLNKTLASAVRGYPREYSELHEKVLFLTVGDIRVSSEDELKQKRGVGQLGAQLIIGAFAKPIPQTKSIGFSTN